MSGLGGVFSGERGMAQEDSTARSPERSGVVRSGRSFRSTECHRAAATMSAPEGAGDTPKGQGCAARRAERPQSSHRRPVGKPKAFDFQPRSGAGVRLVLLAGAWLVGWALGQVLNVAQGWL